ncbi:hypothetical protein [Cytobacillus firmus]|uniref:hypothetical protein n=1 Tax=Cytobacillus firmus TaxID=1399 RepID=UPI001362DCB3|nr:hypothetical protein [Cytobacillus firmus]
MPKREASWSVYGDRFLLRFLIFSFMKRSWRPFLFFGFIPPLFPSLASKLARIFNSDRYNLPAA